MVHIYARMQLPGTVAEVSNDRDRQHDRVVADDAIVKP